jgi:putative ABC transport system permease protein
MREVIIITLLNLQNLPQRLGSSLVTVIGITGVVAVLLSVMALATGFRQTIENSSCAERAIILSRGAEVEAGSGISRAAANTLMDAPGISRNSAGKPIASAEVLIIAPVARKSDGLDAYVTLRGVGTQGLALRPQIKLVAGRTFAPAVHELIVGKAAAARFAGLEIGKRILLRGGEWTVVGVFESGGSAHESALLADAETVLAAYQLKTFNSVTAKLTTPAALETLKAAASADPTLELDIQREREYAAKSAKPLHRMLNLLAWSIGGIMAAGALFGALNTMYSAVSSRTVEIATLRAIGFSSLPIVISVLFEALLLVLIGALLGTAIAIAGFNDRAINMLGSFNMPSQLVYQLAVTPASVGIAVGLAVLLGLLGGVLPAARAARISIAAGIRSR